jgi:hypothetical protein
MKSTEDIVNRNHRVELDKAWETSYTRRGIIALIIYGVASFFMIRIGVGDPFLNALVPTGGYLLSTLSLSVIKKWWIRKNDK